jgi:hypothetical protein
MGTLFSRFKMQKTRPAKRVGFCHAALAVFDSGTLPWRPQAGFDFVVEMRIKSAQENYTGNQAFE